MPKRDRPRKLGPWGDSSFKGRGIIRCYICNKPTKNHKIGPCDKPLTEEGRKKLEERLVDGRKYRI